MTHNKTTKNNKTNTKYLNQHKKQNQYKIHQHKKQNQKKHFLFQFCSSVIRVAVTFFYHLCIYGPVKLIC
jgi:hypothetical protein